MNKAKTGTFAVSLLLTTLFLSYGYWSFGWNDYIMLSLLLRKLGACSESNFGIVSFFVFNVFFEWACQDF